MINDLPSELQLSLISSGKGRQIKGPLYKHQLISHVKVPWLLIKLSQRSANKHSHQRPDLVNPIEGNGAPHTVDSIL